MAIVVRDSDLTLIKKVEKEINLPENHVLN